MPVATFHFHDSLNFFLPRKQKQQAIEYAFDWKGSIKDMIESLNVPHPEIALLIVNRHSVDFDYIVQPNDDIHVYPNLEAIDITPKIPLIPPYQGRPKFILDTHLGRLANYLRMMGFDTLYRNDYPDDELAEVSHHENRILLTRDIGLLKRSLVVYGYYVRNTKPRKRLSEIMQRYDLITHMIPFRHCLRCNGFLKPVAKELIADNLPYQTVEYFDEFHQCQSCGQIYWKGSHYEKMVNLIAEVQIENL